ncbi:MAG: hypothetical protein AB9917_19025 [Negativicutes bacterium]
MSAKIYFTLGPDEFAPHPHPPLHPAQPPDAQFELLPKALHPLHAIYPAATTPIAPTNTVSILHLLVIIEIFYHLQL